MSGSTTTSDSVPGDWEGHFRRIYATEADRYHRLVKCEDAHGELATRLTSLAAVAPAIVDIGTGTGRIATAVCRPGNRVYGVDVAEAMLEVAACELAAQPGDWSLGVGDARELPVADDSADAAIAGWVYGHFTQWWPESWASELELAIAEMDRVTRPGGIEVVVDTLGTAVAQPVAPTPALALYHQRLADMGFGKTVLRTDYRFVTVAESIELLDWFFGLGDWARDHGDLLVPEFTGWWERYR